MSKIKEFPAEYRGHVVNGMVVLDNPVKLPEGSEVRVRSIPARRKAPKRRKKMPTLYERLKPIIGIAKGLPRDFSINHDHYLYGLPKKKG